MNKLIVFLFSFTFLSTLLGQEIERYCKTSDSNCFVFIRNEDIFGEFSFACMPMYGKGTFNETKRKIVLYYERPLKDTIIYKYNDKHHDTLLIYCTNAWGKPLQESLFFQYKDTKKFIENTKDEFFQVPFINDTLHIRQIKLDLMEIQLINLPPNKNEIYIVLGTHDVPIYCKETVTLIKKKNGTLKNEKGEIFTKRDIDSYESWLRDVLNINIIW